MAWTDDPVRDAVNYERGCRRRRISYPQCDCCLEEIADECFYLINNKNFCEDCLNECFLVRTEDYIREEE